MKAKNKAEVMSHFVVEVSVLKKNKTRILTSEKFSRSKIELKGIRIKSPKNILEMNFLNSILSTRNDELRLTHSCFSTAFYSLLFFAFVDVKLKNGN